MLYLHGGRGCAAARHREASLRRVSTDHRMQCVRKCAALRRSEGGLRSADLSRRIDSPLSLAPEYEDYTFEQWRHGEFDAYWKQMGIYAEGFYGAFSDAPMVHMSSWYDPYPRTATQNYIGLSRLKRSPVRLILGPWTHGDRTLTFAGDVDFGPAATGDRIARCVEIAKDAG